MGAWRTAVGSPTVPVTQALSVDHGLLLHPRQRALLPADPGLAPAHTVVVAPTGYAKTALVAEHVRSLRHAGLPTAWLTLGPAHRTARALRADLAAALRDGLPGPGVPSPRPGQDDADPTDGHPDPAPRGSAIRPGGSRWRRLLQDLDGSSPPLTLVLDDVGRVDGPDALEVLSELVEAPASVRVIWVGRREPAVGLTRRRLEGGVRDVRAEDLALRPDEVATVLARTRKVPVADVGQDEVRDALARTAGWPAAVAVLAGPDRLREYVTEQVLDGLGAEEVELLRRTSVVDEVPVDLAVRLSGRQDAGAGLHELRRRTGLLEHVPAGEGAYRCHPTVRAVLREQLHERGAGSWHDSHAVASRWFGEAGQHWPAVQHAAGADDCALFRRTLLEHGLGVLLAGPSVELRRLLRVRALGARSAVEVVHHALAVLDEGDVAEADALLVHVRSLRHGDGWDDRLEQLYGCLVLRRARSVVGRLPDEASHLVADLRDPGRRARLDIDVGLHVLADLAAFASREGDHDAAHGHLEHARSLARLYGYPALEVQCLVGLSAVELARSGLRASRVHAEAAVARAAGTGQDRSNRLAFAHTVVAWSAHQQLDDEVARTSAALAVAALDGSVDPMTETTVRGCAAFVAFEAGDRYTALLALHRMASGFVPGRTDPAIVANVLPRALRLCLRQGEWGWAQQCLELTDAMLPGTGESVLGHALWARARHRDDVARRALADAARLGTPCRVHDTLLELQLLRAVLLGAVRDHGGAHDSLVLALATARPDGTVRPFVDAAPSLLPLLVAAAGRAGELESWRAHVTDVVRLRSATGGVAPGSAGLTPREMAVLADLPSLLPLSAIAAQHHVSPNTLKTQVKAIYRKLGVSSRHDAVNRARLQGLLPS